MEPKMKKKFVIKVEGIAPVKMEFEVWAYDAEEAYESLNRPSSITPRMPPRVDLSRMKRTKVEIKDPLTSEILMSKNS
jgi:hypothetical protein